MARRLPLRVAGARSGCVALASREKEHGTTGYDRTLQALEALPALGVALAKRRFTVVLAPVRIVADGFSPPLARPHSGSAC